MLSSEEVSKLHFLDKGSNVSLPVLDLYVLSTGFFIKHLIASPHPSASYTVVCCCLAFFSATGHDLIKVMNLNEGIPMPEKSPASVNTWAPA